MRERARERGRERERGGSERESERGEEDEALLLSVDHTHNINSDI